MHLLRQFPLFIFNFKRLVLYPVVTSFVIVVSLWHISSLLNFSHYSLKIHWESEVLTFTFGNKTKRYIVKSHRRSFAETLDYSQKILRGAGYIFRYSIGDLPSFIFQRSHATNSRFYLRSEVCQGLFSSRGENRNAAGAIAAVSERLRTIGYKVFPLVVPSKVSIERDFVGGLPACDPSGVSFKKDLQMEDFDFLHEILSNESFSAVNLFDKLNRSRESSKDKNLFSPVDTHWTSLGIAHAAMAILEKLSKEGLVKGDFYLKESGSIPREWMWGDFLTYLQLPKWFVERKKSLVWTEPLYSVEAKNFSVLAEFRLIQAGTSFSARLREMNFDLPTTLRKIVGSERVIDYSFPRAGPWGGLTNFLACNYPAREGDIIIWEFPIIDLPLKDKSLEEIRNSVADYKCRSF